ncbi:AAA family ATPase [Planctomycetota bacterium]
MPIVTAFSASHCGADEVSNALAEKLGYRHLGDELLDLAAERFTLPRKKLDRALHGPPSFFDGLTRERQRCVAHVRLALAECVQDDNLVYHGFASHLLPNDNAHVLKVCLLADRPFRIERAVTGQGLSEKAARKTIEKDDSARAEWTRHLFNIGPWDQTLYDVKIPLHQTSLEQALLLISENLPKLALSTAEHSHGTLADLLLSARVNLALVENGHDVEVGCVDGHVSLVINEYAVRLEHLKQGLQQIADGVAGVKSTSCRVGPGFRPPSRYDAVAPPEDSPRR